jgi:HD-like signal output (HDOD) protein
MANSVSFNRGVPVRSLSEAVARLGFEQLLQLIARPEANSDAPA